MRLINLLRDVEVTKLPELWFVIIDINSSLFQHQF